MNLRTYDYLFLYAINTKTNKIYLKARASIDYGIAGAIIYELMKAGIVVIDNNELTIKETEIDNETLSSAIALIKKINKKSVRKNTSRIANRIGAIKTSIVKNLVQQGIIEWNEKLILGIFQNNVYILKNKELLPAYTQKLKSTFNEEVDATNNEVMVLNLIEACGLVKKVFPDKMERRKFKSWLKK